MARVALIGTQNAELRSFITLTFLAVKIIVPNSALTTLDAWFTLILTHHSMPEVKRVNSPQTKHAGDFGTLLAELKEFTTMLEGLGKTRVKKQLLILL